MGLENLFQGLQMFQQGLKEYSTSKAIGQATEAVNQLNQSELNDQQKRVEHMKLANNLALHLGQLGAPVSQIQSATGAIKPQQFGSAQEMMMEGYLTGNQGLTKQGQEIAAKFAQPGIDAENRKFKRDQYLKQMEIDAELNKARITAGAKGRELKPVNDAHIDKIVSLESVPSMLDSLSERISTEDIGVGPVTGRNPIRSLMPDTAAFDADLGRIKAEYRKAVTGAGMSESERKELDQNMPTATDTVDVFRAKVEKLKEFSVKERSLLLQNLKKFGRDVSAFEQPQQQVSTEEKVIGNIIYKRVPGGWIPK